MPFQLGMVMFILTTSKLITCSFVHKNGFAFKGYVHHGENQHVLQELSKASEQNMMGFCSGVCVHENACSGFEICDVNSQQSCRLSNAMPPTKSQGHCRYFRNIRQYSRFCSSASVDKTCLGLYPECSDCDCVLGYTNISGIYEVKMVGAFVTVECVLLDGHSYTVILSRRNGKVDFNRSYGEYESGFGSPNTEMWLGNKYIHFLTSYRWSILRIELTYSNSSVVDVEYGHIQVLHPRYNYYLHIHDFSGNTSDMMSYLDGRRFGANDYDSGRCGCPILASGGWWCEHSCNTTCSLTSPYNGSPYYFGWDCASEVEANARLLSAKMMIRFD